MAGSFSFIGGLTSLSGLAALSDDPADRLFEINVFVGSAVIFVGLGGFLTYQAASAFGRTGSSAMQLRPGWLWLAGAFPAFVAAGQWMAADPERLPWLFPVVNLGVVGIPSLLLAGVAVARYQRANPLSWPVSWREGTSGFVYGAIGATSLGGIVNTVYLVAAGAFLIHWQGEGDIFTFDRNLQTLPDRWGIAFDLSVLSVVAPLNEEFFKGFLVALFFFRQGGPARCFCWGVLAGTGFNLLETYFNSLVAVNPRQLADQTIGNQWWLFALSRAGTAAMHGFAAGFAALGLYGLFRRQWRYLPGYPFAVLVHGAWNGAVYLILGDAFLSAAGPDAFWLDVLGVGMLAGLAVATAAGIWIIPGALRDDQPAPLYSALGMRPATPAWLKLPI